MARVLLLRILSREKNMCDPEEIIRAAMKELSGCFSDDTEANVRELLSSGETGIGLEVLCSQLVEFDIAVSVNLKEQLALGASLMKMYIEELNDLNVV